MKYSELNLKVKSDIKSIKLNNGVTIGVKQYLPIREKLSLINIALQNSLVDGYYDPVLLEVMFNIYVIFSYSDLDFTDEERSDVSELYDEMLTNGYIDKILTAIPKEEYNELLGYLEEKQAAATQYKGSLADAITTLVTEFPKSAEEARNIVDNFDADKYENVINFAKAANNGKLPE